MSGIRVKICGITSLKDLLMATEAGADAVGFVVDVPQSPRNLSINEAKKLMRSTPIFVETVAVIVPQDLSHLEKIHKNLNPNVIQIHGSSCLYKDIRDRFPDALLIGAIQAKSDLKIDAIIEAADAFDAILLDSYVSGKCGGTGRTHDWEISKDVKEAIRPKPLILAGGLRPENVREAISMVKPYAVDVSSGVELSPRVKDRKKVFEFIKNAKEVEI
jgi:phosphoribosylanthranilate isomerase